MFVFPKPSPESNTSSTDAADVAELLLNLSIFGFSQLSASDQREKTKEMYNKVVEDVIVEQLPEESEENLRVRTFTELFKKLPFPDQNHFLSTVIKKFKRERQIGELISWFSTELDAIQQQELIEELVHVAAGDETITNEDLRLRRFTQLCRDYTDYVYEHVAIRKEYVEKRKRRKYTEETSGNDQVCSDWQSRFAEFFLGFSIIWFKGQNSCGQWQLIEQLCGGVKGVIVEKLEDGSEADFKLRRFTELCKKVVDFGVQAQFLDKVEQKLLQPRRYLPHGRLLQPQDSSRAAELLSQLSSFGFSLLSIDDQRDKIKQISYKSSAEVVNFERFTGESQEDLRKKTFMELFNKAPIFTQFYLFKELTEKFFSQRRLCEAIVLFRQLGSSDQQEQIEEMFGRSMDVRDMILEKLSEESEEDFRLRRFIKLCSTYTYLLDGFIQYEAKKRDLKALELPTLANEEIYKIKQFRYAEFYFGLSVIWFRWRCAKDPRNPIQVLLSKYGEDDHIIEKLPNETEEDFRLRRFTESFEQLEFSSQEGIVKYIRDTIAHDLGYREKPKPTACEFTKPSKSALDLPLRAAPEPRPPLSSEFIKVKIPNLRGGEGVAITQGGGDGSDSQGGQGTNQNTN